MAGTFVPVVLLGKVVVLGRIGACRGAVYARRPR